MNEIEVSANIFESIKHIDEFGHEYWFARELQSVLEYKKCEKSGYDVNDHFPVAGKMVEIGSKTK